MAERITSDSNGELSPEDSGFEDAAVNIKSSQGRAVSASTRLKAANIGNADQISLLQDSLAEKPVENSVRIENQLKDVPLFQGFGKGFKVFLDDNTVLSTTKYINENGFNIIPEQMDPNYDPFSDIPEDKLNYVNNYKYANTPEEVARISNRIDKELENKRILSQEVGTGAQLTSGLLAGILDPVNLIPVGGEVYKSFKLGEVATGALRTAAAGFVSQTAAEGILQAQQETRTAGESAANIASATLLSGILGAGSSLLTKEKFNEVAGKVNKDLTSEKADLTIDPVNQKLIPNNSELVKNIDPEVQKVVNDFLQSQKSKSLTADQLTELSVQRIEQESKLAEFDKSRNELFTENLREAGYPVDVVQGYTNQVEEFVNQRKEQRESINPGKTGKRLKLFDEETNQKLEELRSNLDFVKSENDQGKFKEISSKIKQDRQEIVNQIKDLEKRIASGKEDVKSSPDVTEKELPPILEQDQVLPENQTIDEARSVGARQNVPYQDLYDKYLEENLKTGKQPITFEQFRNGMESLTPGIGGAAKRITKSLSKVNPILRTFNSRSIEAKILLQELGTHNMIVGKNEAGIASQQSVEVAVKQWKAGLGESVKFNTNSFKEFKKRTGKEGVATPIKTIADFNAEVSKSLRRGDISEIPEISNAAKNWRSKVFDPLKNAAIEEKLLPEDVKPETAVSYLSRLWNRKAVIAKEPELRQIISNKLTKFELPKIEGMQKKELLDLEAKIKDLTPNNPLKVFHGTAQDFDKFNFPSGENPFKKEGIGPHFGTEEQAKFVASIKEGGKVKEFYLDIKNPVRLEDRNAWSHAAVLQQLKEKKVISEDEFDYLLLRKDNVDARKILKEKGYDGIVYDNTAEGKGDSFIPLSQDQIKSNKPLTKDSSKSLASLKEKYSKLNTEHEFHFGDFKENYVKEIVDSILSNLKGEQRFAAVTNYDFKITNRGPLKERTLSFIRDEEVEKFLENDVEKIADRYTRIMGTDVELKRQFGDINFEDRLNKVTKEYEELAAKAKTEVERAKLQKEKQQVLGDLQVLRDVMRGLYGTPENPDSVITRGFRVGRQLNYVTKLGGVVLSSLNDPINTISVHGMMRFSQGLGHMIGNLKGVKLNVKEAKRAGNILENVLHSRLATMAEITDPYNSGHSVFERFIDNVQQLGSKLNGLGLWTDTMKSFSSVLTQQRLIKESSKLLNGKIKNSNRTYLAFLGIDENNVKLITNQIEKFGTKEKSLWVANTDKWTDKEAVRLYRNALNQDVDRTIVTPTAGDVPLFMRTELGKTIGQFKSFTFASTQQVLIRSLQQKDAAALNGMIASIAMGMLIYHVKSVAAGKETSDDPRKWIAEGVDRSGILGVLMEINNIAEKVSRGTVGINPLIGGEIMSRYASRNIVDTLAGPTAGQIKDLAGTIGAITSGDIKESDVKAFRRMLPYQNVFYLSGLFNLLETGMSNAVGAE